MSLLKRIYWKPIGVLARVSRSVAAVNQGFTPSGSPSNGPQQPLSALRDAVTLLGSTAGRIDARLESLALGQAGPTDTLTHAAALAEVSQLNPSEPILVLGDAVAMRVAADLGSLGFDVTFGDTAGTLGLPLDAGVTRAGQPWPKLPDVLAVWGTELDHLPVDVVEGAGDALAAAHLAVICAPGAVGDAAPAEWLGSGASLRTHASPVKQVHVWVRIAEQ